MANNSKSSQAETKVYTMLAHTQPSAPIFQVVNDKKTRIDKAHRWRPFLQYTFMDEDNKNVTIRFKLSSNSIFQDVQVKEENIPANAKFTTAERNLLKFANGVAVVRNPIAQEFLESCPHFNGFKGTSNDDTIKPVFGIYNKVEEAKNQNKLTRDTIKAANKILSMKLYEAQDLYIRVFGVGSFVPTDIDECHAALIDELNEGQEVIDLVLKSKLTAQEEANVLVGNLVNKGVISFDAVPNMVSQKVGDKWVDLRQLSSVDYAPEQRVSLFIDFLLSDAGKPLKENLEKELE